jgi:hypothetical protein
VLARLLVCEECGCVSDDDARGWSAYLAEDVEGVAPTSVATFCPECAAEEFGYSIRAADERDIGRRHGSPDVAIFARFCANAASE